MDTVAQIGLVHTKGLPARLIQGVTQSHWNHAIIGTPGGNSINAEPGGVRERPVSLFPEVVWSQFPYTPTQRDKILTYAQLQVGAPYNWADDILIGVTLLIDRVAPHWMNPDWLTGEVADRHSFQCSQLCDAALQFAGIHVFEDGRPSGAVYPASFVPLFRDNGWMTADQPR